MTSIDPFNGYSSDRDGPFDNMDFVEPSDESDLPVIASTLFFQGRLPVSQENPDGSLVKVKITTAGGQTWTLETPTENRLTLPVRVRKVWATGTTALTIVALW